jgi:hypothetical protein
VDKLGGNRVGLGFLAFSLHIHTYFTTLIIILSLSILTIGL